MKKCKYAMGECEVTGKSVAGMDRTETELGLRLCRVGQHMNRTVRVLFV